MDTAKFKSIKMSLMESTNDINENNKGEYLIKGTSNFKIPSDFYKEIEISEEELTSSLLESIYEELINNINNVDIVVDVDTVGIWIEYDGEILENAMKISTLEDIKEFGSDEIVPIYELFKLTIDNI